MDIGVALDTSVVSLLQFADKQTSFYLKPEILAPVVTVVVGILLTWFFNRRLERFKAEIIHKYEIDRLRTSFVADHQRTAFSEILTALSKLDRNLTKLWSDKSGFVPIPPELTAELDEKTGSNALFLDEECCIGLSIVDEVLAWGLSTNSPDSKWCRQSYTYYEYTNEQMQNLLRQKFGLSISRRAFWNLCILGSIISLDYYRELTECECDKVFSVMNPAPGDLVGQGWRNLPRLRQQVENLIALLEEKADLRIVSEIDLPRLKVYGLGLLEAETHA